MNITTFSAFKNRNFSLFFTGQTLSQIGTWMQRTGVSWLVYTMTHSALMLGVTIFALQFPAFLFSLPGGVVADRYSRRKILLITQTLSMVQAVFLAILVLSGQYRVWEILTLSAMLGTINAFDMPARQPLVHETVKDKKDLANALALNSSMVNLARLIGPALSGMVLKKYGAGVCFSLNAVSFVAVIVSLLLMKFNPYNPPTVKKKMIAELEEGFVYLKHTPAIRTIMLMLALSAFLVLPYNTLLPVFAKVIYKGDAGTFGYINSFIGMGAICGSVFLASLKPGTNLKFVLLVNTVILGISLLLFSQITNFKLAMPFAILSGLGMMSQTTIIMTIIQMHADKNMRGRVMSYVAFAYFGMLPLGSLMIGGVSQKIGAPAAISCQGIATLIIATIFFKHLSHERFKKGDTERIEEDETMLAEKM